MREIKFRAWDKTKNEMFGVISLGKNEIVLSRDKQDIRWGSDDSLDDYEIMQFTGLKDKNGKEIYEGDIVHYFFMGKEWIEPILWQMINSMENSFSGFRIHGCWANCEIIGTIYENPELLKNE